jgi:putative sigma-54 modulation protein
MRLTIQAINFSPKSKLKKLIAKRIDKFQHFYSKILATDLYLKHEKSANERAKQVEIKVRVPGDIFIVKKESSTFEEAIDAASKAVERLLIRRKEKQIRAFQNGL